MSRVIAFPALSIETARLADLDEVAALVHRVWHAAYDRRLPAELCAERTPARLRELIAERIDTASVARLGRRVIGYCDHVANCIDGVWVDAQYRRRGIGSRLLAHQLQYLRRQGLPTVQVACEAFNRAATAFFESQGWYVLEEAVEPLAGERDIAIIVFGYSL
jgi:GNAT superfamily N-acetyltransferase